jgi:hypothetical protein
MDRREVIIDLAKHRSARAAARRHREQKASEGNVRRGDGYRHLIEYALSRFQALLPRPEGRN